MARPRNRASRLVLDVGDYRTYDHAIQALDALKDTETELEQLGDVIAGELKSRFIDHMLEQLRHYPPEAAPGTFAQYATPKQFRYVMWLISSGQWTGRTGALAAGWQGEVTFKAGGRDAGIRVRVENTATNQRGKRYAPFVQGNIGLGHSERSIQRYRRPIQKFHQVTGWQEAWPIIAVYYEQMDIYANREYELGARALWSKVLS